MNWMPGWILKKFPAAVIEITKQLYYFHWIFRLLEMRMPRSSSFSVRDILDLPQMKNNSSQQQQQQSATSDTSPTHTTDISTNQRFHGKLIRSCHLTTITISFIIITSSSYNSFGNSNSSYGRSSYNGDGGSSRGSSGWWAFFRPISWPFWPNKN